MRKFLFNLFFNYSIKATTAFIVVGIASVSIIIIAGVAINSVAEVGKKTRNISIAALEDKIKNHLTQIAKSVADSNDLVFEKISKDADNTAFLATNIFDNSQTFTRGVYWKFDTSISKGVKGQYLNDKKEVSSVFIPSYVPIDDSLRRDLELSAYLDFLFPKVLEGNSSAIAIWTIGKRGEVRYYPNIDLGNILPPDLDSTKEVFYTPGTPKNNPEKKVKWSIVYDDPAGQGFMISAVAPIYTKQRGFAGVIGIDVTLNNIIKAIEDNKLIPNTSTFLIDKNGHALALPEHLYKELFGKDRKEGEGRVDLSILKNEFGPVIDKMKSGEDGFEYVTVHGENHYVAYAHLPSTGFSFGVVAEEDEILSVVNNLKKTQDESVRNSIYLQIIPIGLSILLCAWILGLLFLRQLIKPLDDLAKVAKKISMGDFSLKYNLSYKNEIGQLASSFNYMTDKLNESYSGLENKIKEKTMDLAKNLGELQKSNDSLENMDKAMINILEDAKELEDELKVEKAGVEKKVEERTLELSEEQARLTASINNLPVGFVMVDIQQNIILMNGIAKSILCLKQENHSSENKDGNSVNGRDCDISEINERLKGSLDIKLTIDKVIKTGQPFEAKDLALEGLFLHVFIAPISVANEKKLSVIGAVILVENITEAKVLERSRDEFFSIASHELRTPLTSIKGNSSLIQEYYADKFKDDKDLKEMIDDIHESSVRLIGIVNDFLDLSRLEQGRIEFKKEVFDIVPLIEKVVYDIAATAKEKKITVKFDQPSGTHPNVEADSARTKQIIYNLLGNAIKFTDKGGVTIGIDIKDKLLNVRVTDTGKGVPQQSQSLLFRKFQQAENNILTRDTTQGTGLGLYISKLMAQGMGGDVVLESSEENKGSTFLLSLPLADVNAKLSEILPDSNNSTGSNANTEVEPQAIKAKAADKDKKPA